MVNEKLIKEMAEFQRKHSGLSPKEKLAELAKITEGLDLGDDDEVWDEFSKYVNNLKSSESAFEKHREMMDTFPRT